MAFWLVAAALSVEQSLPFALFPIGAGSGCGIALLGAFICGLNRLHLAVDLWTFDIGFRAIVHEHGISADLVSELDW